MNDTVISQCGSYRYMLRRGSVARCAVVLLNPSTAGTPKPDCVEETSDDRTSSKLLQHAIIWGYKGYDLFNVGAGRATDPKEWLAMRDPIGPDNDYYLQLASYYPLIVVGWGAHAPRYIAMRAASILTQQGANLMCFGVNADGSPMHPLYRPYREVLKLWEPA